jgi:hypothetical protein
VESTGIWLAVGNSLAVDIVVNISSFLPLLFCRQRILVLHQRLLGKQYGYAKHAENCNPEKRIGDKPINGLQAFSLSEDSLRHIL